MHVAKWFEFKINILLIGKNHIPGISRYHYVLISEIGFLVILSTYSLKKYCYKKKKYCYKKQEIIPPPPPNTHKLYNLEASCYS